MTDNTIPAYEAGKRYELGDRVTHEGKTYVANAVKGISNPLFAPNSAHANRPGFGPAGDEPAWMLVEAEKPAETAAPAPFSTEKTYIGGEIVTHKGGLWQHVGLNIVDPEKHANEKRLADAGHSNPANPSYQPGRMFLSGQVDESIWRRIGDAPEAAATGAEPITPFDKKTVYMTGTRVTFNGKTYERSKRYASANPKGPFAAPPYSTNWTEIKADPRTTARISITSSAAGGVYFGEATLGVTPRALTVGGASRDGSTNVYEGKELRAIFLGKTGYDDAKTFLRAANPITRTVGLDLSAGPDMTASAIFSGSKATLDAGMINTDAAEPYPEQKLRDTLSARGRPQAEIDEVVAIGKAIAEATGMKADMIGAGMINPDGSITPLFGDMGEMVSDSFTFAMKVSKGWPDDKAHAEITAGVQAIFDTKGRDAFRKDWEFRTAYPIGSIVKFDDMLWVATRNLTDTDWAPGRDPDPAVKPCWVPAQMAFEGEPEVDLGLGIDSGDCDCSACKGRKALEGMIDPDALADLRKLANGGRGLSEEERTDAKATAKALAAKTRERIAAGEDPALVIRETMAEVVKAAEAYKAKRPVVDDREEKGIDALLERLFKGK